MIAIRSLLRQLWRTLTEPTAQVQGLDRGNARLLAALLIALLPLGLLSALVPPLLNPALRLLTDWDFIIAIPSILLWLVAYGLSRTRHYRSGALLALVIAAVATFVAAVLEAEYSNLGFLLIVVLLSSMVLPMRETVWIAAASALGILLLPLLTQQLSLLHVIVAPLAFLLFGSVLVYVATHHRNTMEHKRQAELKDSEARYRQLFAASQRQTEQIEALRALSQDLVMFQDLDTLLRQIIDRAAKLLNAEAGGIYLHRPEEEVLEWVVSIGKGVAPYGTKLSRGEGLSGRVWDTGESLTVEDYDRWAGRSPQWPSLPASVIAVPIQWRGEFLGVLNLRSSLGREAFTPDETALLAEFSAQAAIAIHNAQLFEQAQQEIAERKRVEESEVGQRKLAETLRDVTLALTSQTDPGAVLAEIVRQARRVVPYTSANLAMRDGDMIRIVHLEGYPQAISQKLSVPERRWDALPLDRRAIESRQPVFVPDTLQSADWQKLSNVLWRSYLSIPIILRDDVLGLLRLNGEKPFQFSEQDAERLAPLANVAAIALDQAQLFQETRRQAEELEALRRVALDITARLDLNTLLRGLVESVLQLLDAYSGSLFLYRPERDALEWSLRIGPGDAPIGIDIQRGEGLAGLVWEQNQALVVDEYASLPQSLPALSSHKLGSVVGVPIYSGDQFLGVLCATKAEGALEPFTEQAGRLLGLFADQAAVAINNARLYEQAQAEIAERRRAESAMRSSEERYRTLFDGVPLGLYRSTAGGKFLDANPGLIQMLGYPDRQALLARNVQDLYLRPGERQMWKDRLERNQVVRGVELQLSRYDGSVIWVRDNVRLLRNEADGTIYYEGSLEDITERKHAEDERERLSGQIQEQAQQMQQLMDAVPEGVLLLDTDGRVLVANPQGRRVLASMAGAGEGDTLSRLGDHDLAELLTSPPQGLWHELKIDGLVFEAIGQPLEIGPETGGWVLVVRDVTQEREIQARHQQQERLAAVGQLAAGIAHDFNNIMSIIVLHAQISQRTGGLPRQVPERLAAITEQAKRASSLIQQILDFSRRAVLERQPLDLLPVFKEEVRLLERALPENIRVQLAYSDETFIVSADLTRLQQIIMNLALNARDAMPGGGELRIELDRVRVLDPKAAPLVEMAAGEWVRICVSDTGVGIPGDVAPHIFEPFFTTKAPDRGIGLGLAQVYGIVKQHEGHIVAESRVGQGALFAIYLPALATLEPVPAQDVTTSLPLGKSETILLVEDDAGTRAAVADSLHLLNYRVLEASHGKEALGIFWRHKGRIALVLTDVVMPEMGGKDLLRALREQDPSVKVMLMTGHPLQDEGKGLQGTGAVSWLQKPVGLLPLAEAIARALSGDA